MGSLASAGAATPFAVLAVTARHGVALTLATEQARSDAPAHIAWDIFRPS